jgi:hypothetical protein
MNWQETVVIFIVGLCVGLSIYRFFSFFRKSKKGDDVCTNCTCGCCNSKRVSGKKHNTVKSEITKLLQSLF